MSDNERYAAAAHAMQSAVVLELSIDSKSAEPKHLRVGINSAMSDVSALATLLIEKGIFTKEEYVKAVADSMERERDLCAESAKSKLPGNHYGGMRFA